MEKLYDVVGMGELLIDFTMNPGCVQLVIALRSDKIVHQRCSVE